MRRSFNDVGLLSVDVGIGVDIDRCVDVGDGVVNDDVGGGSGRLVVVGFRNLERHLGGGGRHGRPVAREEEADRKLVIQSQSHLRRNQEDHLSGSLTKQKFASRPLIIFLLMLRILAQAVKLLDIYLWGKLAVRPDVGIWCHLGQSLVNSWFKAKKGLLYLKAIIALFFENKIGSFLLRTSGRTELVMLHFP